MRPWDLRNWRPPSEAAASRGYRTHGRKPAVGYCQRCREGVYVPEKELRRCPGCARDVCADCRTDAPEIESQVCLDCARARRAAKGAYRRSLRFFGLVALAATAIVVGRYVALNTAWSSI